MGQLRFHRLGVCGSERHNTATTLSQGVIVRYCFLVCIATLFVQVRFRTIIVDQNNHVLFVRSDRRVCVGHTRPDRSDLVWSRCFRQSKVSVPWKAPQLAEITDPNLLWGCVQSTFAEALQQHFPRFRRCNQDDLGGNRRRVEQLAYETLEQGLSVCIDRTNFNTA